jgi:hypothetical protein
MTLLRYVPLHARHTNLCRRTSGSRSRTETAPHLHEGFFLPSRRQTKSPDTSITTTLFLQLLSCLERVGASNRCVIVQVGWNVPPRVYFRPGHIIEFPSGFWISTIGVGACRWSEFRECTVRRTEA